MVKLFYFDIQNRGTTIIDKVGAEAADLEEAEEEAAAAIQELRDSGEAAEVGEGWHLLIRSVDGTVLKRLPIGRRFGPRQ